MASGDFLRNVTLVEDGIVVLDGDSKISLRLARVCDLAYSSGFY